MRRAVALGLLGAGLLCPSGMARAFGIFGTTTLEGGLRWDAAPRMVIGPPTPNGVERSLDGGLRYSLQGGSYEAFRDTFYWGSRVPSAAEFQAALERGFAHWVSTDPVTGLGTDLSFVPDLATEAIFDPFAGAEIDLFSSNDGSFWDPGYDRWAGEVYFQVDLSSHDDITLTSGTTGYAGVAIGERTSCSTAMPYGRSPPSKPCSLTSSATRSVSTTSTDPLDRTGRSSTTTTMARTAPPRAIR
jgi:hypothetical protein